LGVAAEGDLQGIGQSRARRLGGAQIGAHGDVHADVAGAAREQGADQEAEGRPPVQGQAQDQEQHDADNGDGRVLPVQIGGGALLDGGGDLAHPLVAGGLRQHPAYGYAAVEQREHGAEQGKGKWRVNHGMAS